MESSQTDKMNRINNLLQAAKSKSLSSQLRIAAVLGEVVADAAAKPVHWIYDAQKLQDILQKYPAPEFIPENQCPFYTLPTGRNSVYADIAKQMLGYLEKNSGIYNSETFAQNLYDIFSNEENEYQVAFKKRANGYPVEGPWISKSLLSFIENKKGQNQFIGDVNSKDGEGICSSIPLIAVGKQDDLFGNVGTNIKFFNGSEHTQQFGFSMMRLLQYLFSRKEANYDREELLNQVVNFAEGEYKGIIQEALSQSDLTHQQFVQKYGSSCGLPGSYLGAIHAVVNNNTFVDAVRATIQVGGDNCSRSCYVGAIMGASLGLDAIPVEWIANTDDGEKTLQQAVNLLKD